MDKLIEKLKATEVPDRYALSLSEMWAIAREAKDDMTHTNSIWLGFVYGFIRGQNCEKNKKRRAAR